ncbi:MAG: Holliday junction resolvase RuvX [Candidatus Pacebacteria bacterium]|nr:Holliday junction resolvase RuvX [Candidatus Paceibacterota bacterium]
MKYLGIDYGEKNVGIAISDDSGEMAFAKIVLENDKNLLENILNICNEENIETIVIGESFNFEGKPNPIMKKISFFKKELENNSQLPVYLEPEFLTSAEAERIQGKTDKLDASAAALILKSYLDSRLQN